MNVQFKSIALSLLLAGAGTPASAMMIDNFASMSQFSIGYTEPPPVTPSTVVYDQAVDINGNDGGIILGGYRTAYISNIQKKEEGMDVSFMTYPNGNDSYSEISNYKASSTLTLIWDGTTPPSSSTNPANWVNTTGLAPGVDFTAPNNVGGPKATSLRIAIDMAASNAPDTTTVLTFDVWSNVNGSIQHGSQSLTATANQSFADFDFGTFVFNTPDKVDFTKVTALQLTVATNLGNQDISVLGMKYIDTFGNAVVPSPATWSLLVAGLAGMRWSSRRRLAA